MLDAPPLVTAKKEKNTTLFSRKWTTPSEQHSPPLNTPPCIYCLLGVVGIHPCSNTPTSWCWSWGKMPAEVCWIDSQCSWVTPVVFVFLCFIFCVAVCALNFICMCFLFLVHENGSLCLSLWSLPHEEMIMMKNFCIPPQKTVLLGNCPPPVINPGGGGCFLEKMLWEKFWTKNYPTFSPPF